MWYIWFAMSLCIGLCNGNHVVNSTGREYAANDGYNYGSGYGSGSNAGGWNSGGGGGGSDWNSGPPHSDKWNYPTIPTGCVAPVVSGISSLGSKAIFAAILGIALVKLPLLLLLKGFLIKLIIPFGLLWAALPLALPLIYLLFPKYTKGTTTTTPASSDVSGRSLEERRELALQSLLDAPGCIENIACNLGYSHAKSGYDKSMQWMLRSTSKILQKQDDPRFQAYIKSYRNGALGGQCATCPTKLTLQHGDEIYRLI